MKADSKEQLMAQLLELRQRVAELETQPAPPGLPVSNQSRQALPRNENFNQAVLNSLTAHVAILDRQGNIIAVNKAWREFARENGTNPEVVGVGVNYLEVCWAASGPDAATAFECAAGLQAIMNETLPEFELEYPCHSPAEERYFQLCATPLGEKREGIVLLHFNITERKQTEKERQQAEEARQNSIQQMEIAYQQATIYARELKTEISERKQVEKALRENERRYRLLFNSGNDAIFVHKLTAEGMPGKFIEVNDVACRRLGYSREELLKMSPSDIDAKEKQKEVPQIMSGLLASNRSLFEMVHVAKDGRQIPVEINAHLLELDGQAAVLSIVRDITQRKRAEEEIYRRNRELSLLNRIIAASTANLEPKAILEFACQELAQTFDVPRSAAALLNQEQTAVIDIVECGPKNNLPVRSILSALASNSQLRQLLKQRDGLIFSDNGDNLHLTDLGLTVDRDFTSLLVLPLLNNGQLIGGVVLEGSEPHGFIVQEIKLARSVADQIAGAVTRAQLLQAQQRLITAIEQAAESILITDATGTMLYVNPAFKRITGYSPAEALGQNPRLLQSGQQDASFYKELWATISAGETWHGRFINQRKDGSLYTADATISPVRDKEGKIVSYVGVQRDVTQELQLEEQYHQAQKMEAVGRLAGGIAHDFNNILTVITGHVEFLLEELPDLNNPLRESVEEIGQASGRATTLTRQLLTFSRWQPVQLQTLNLNTVITDLQKMLPRLIGEDIVLVTEFDPELGLVEIDPNQINQVLMNLAVNARDAMPQGGRLTLRTANVDLDETGASQNPELEPGPYILLEVEDIGIGMDIETQSQIFEPFFTTKGIGKGTGLGLSVVYAIVQKSNGHISLSSIPGQGTTFLVYLPRLQGAVETIQPVEPAQGFAPTYSDPANILLVEDEMSVRLVMSKFLQKNGFNVLIATDPEEALTLCQEYDGLIDLLVADVVMPRVSGYELAKNLKEIRPDMKVLHISGYSDEELDQYGDNHAEATLLQKPFSSESLIGKVREILSES